MLGKLVTSNTLWITVAIIVLNAILGAIPDLQKAVPGIVVYCNVAVVLIAAAIKVLQELLSPEKEKP